MKKTTLLAALIISGFLVSCSNDNDDNATNSTVIAKTILYTPELINYNTKTVGYYDNQNRKVLDSVFDNTGQFVKKTVTTRTAQTTTSVTYNSSDVLTQNYIEEFDSNGRLLTQTFYDGAGTITSKYSFVYDDASHTITKVRIEGTVSTPGFVYTTNNSGSIYRDEKPSGEVRYFEFQNGKPSRLILVEFDDPATWPNYTYYPAIKPANIRVSTTERNNTVLKIGLEHLPYHWDYFFSSIPEYDYAVQMTFNADNYPLTAKTTFVPSPSLGEMFYYY